MFTLYPTIVSKWNLRQLQTEVFHHTWTSLDLGEAAQYQVVPAIPWAVHVASTATLLLRSGELCQAALADGDVKVVTFEVALPGRNASDVFEVQLPQGQDISKLWMCQKK